MSPPPPAGGPLFGDVFFSPRLFPPAQVSQVPQNPTAVRPTRPAPGGRRTARRPRAALAYTASALSMGSSPRLLANAVWAAIVSICPHLRAYAAATAPRCAAGLARARPQASFCRKAPASSPQRPQSSAAKAMRRQRRRDACARSPPVRRGQAEGAHKRDVNCDLDSSEGGKAIRDNVQPAPVTNGHPEVQVAKGDVGRNPGSRLIADPCRSALERASADQDPRGGASSAVVKFPATTAAESRSESSVSRARWSKQEHAACCHPRATSPKWDTSLACAASTRAAHGGAVKPAARKVASACAAARVHGGPRAPCGSAKPGSSRAKMRLSPA